MDYLIDSNGNKVYYNDKSYDPKTQTNDGGDSNTIPTVTKKSSKPVINPEEYSNFSPNALTIEKAAYHMESPDMGRYAYNERDLDDDYDFYGEFGSFENIVDNRSSRQSNFNKGANAVLGGLLKGVGVALKDLGYMMNPQSYLSILDLPGRENLSEINSSIDWLSDKFVSGVDNMMPIYEEQSEGITDQILSWTTASGILESSVGFALPGMAATKMGTWAVKGVSGTGKILNWISKSAGLSKGEKIARNMMRAEEGFKLLLQTSPTAARIANVAGAAYVQGTGEAIYEAKDAHDAFLEKIHPAVLRGEKDIRDAFNLANEQAQTVYNLNMAKSVLNLGIFDNMTAKFGKGLIDKPSIFQKLKSAIPDIPANVLEEASQDVFKKEAEYSAVTAYNDLNKNSAIIQDLKASQNYIGDELDKDFTHRVGQLFALNSTITAGIIGGISSPIQAGMTRGLGAKGRWKEQMKAYEDQQTFIKDSNKIFESKEAFQKTVEKAALSDHIVNLSTKLDPKALNPMVEKLVYSQEIMEHLAKGTFEKLEEMAFEAQAKGDHHMKNMYKYIQEMKPYIQKAEGKLNSEQIVNTSFTLDQHKALQEYYINKKKEIENKPWDKLTSAEASKLKELNAIVKEYDKVIGKLESELSDLSSFKTQRLLMKSATIEKQLSAVVKQVEDADTPAKLEGLLNEYPELKYSRIFKRQEKLLSMVESITGKSTNPVKAKEEANPVLETVEEKKVKDPKDTATKPENSVEEKVTTKDSTEQRNFISLRAKELGIPLQEEDIIGVEESLDKEMNAIKNEVSEKDLQDASKMIEIRNNLLDEIIYSKAKNRSDLSENIEQNKSNQNLQNRKEIAKSKGIIGPLPEEILNEMSHNRVEAQKKRYSIFEKEELAQTDEEKAEVSKEKKAAEKELQKVSQAEAKNLSKLIRSIVGMDAADIKVSSMKKAFNEIFPNFDAFLTYIENITNTGFVGDNYALLRDIYLTYNKGESLPETYARARKQEAITDYPEGLPTQANDITVDAIVLSSKHTGGFETVVDELSEGSNTIVNRDPTSSISHLSVSYHFAKNENGETIMVDDGNPELSISPLLNPEKYQAGTPITFEVQTDYEGRISLFQNGDTVYFSEVKDFLIDSKGKIRKVTDPKFKEFLELYNMTDAIPEDFIPIKVLGVDGEFLGYMHQPNWMSKLNASKEMITSYKAKMRAKRAFVFKKSRGKGEKSITGKIRKKVMDFVNGKYKGFRINRNYDSKTAVIDQVPQDADITIVGQGNKLYGISKHTNILNSEAVSSYPKGTPFILVPLSVASNGKVIYHAEPITHTQLNPALQETAKSLINAYIEPGKEENKGIIDFYKVKFGIDIITPNGLKNALSQFMYVIDDTENEVESRSSSLNSTGGAVMLGINLKTGVITFANYGSLKIDRTILVSEDIANKERLFGYIEKNFLFAINKENINKASLFVKVAVKTEDGKWDITGFKEYNDFVKANTLTSIQKLNTPDGGVSYTVQNIVDFDIDDSPVDIIGEGEDVKELEKLNKEAKITVLYKGTKTKVTDNEILNKVRTIIQTSIVNKSNINDVVGELGNIGVSVDNTLFLDSYIRLSSKDAVIDEFITNLIQTKPESEGILEPDISTKNVEEVSGFFGKDSNGNTISLSIDASFEEILDVVKDTELAYRVQEALQSENYPSREVFLVMERTSLYKSSVPISNFEFYANLDSEMKKLAEQYYNVEGISIEDVENVMSSDKDGNYIGLDSNSLLELIQYAESSETENRSQTKCK